MHKKFKCNCIEISWKYFKNFHSHLLLKLFAFNSFKSRTHGLNIFKFKQLTFLSLIFLHFLFSSVTRLEVNQEQNSSSEATSAILLGLNTNVGAPIPRTAPVHPHPLQSSWTWPFLRCCRSIRSNHRQTHTRRAVFLQWSVPLSRYCTMSTLTHFHRCSSTCHSASMKWIPTSWCCQHARSWRPVQIWPRQRTPIYRKQRSSEEESPQTVLTKESDRRESK